MRYLVVFITFLLSVTFYGQNDYSMSFDGVDDYVNRYDDFALSLATTTSFYQEPIFGGVTPENISVGAIGFIPNLAYDSWVTVGLEGPASSGESATSILTSAWSSEFENRNSFTKEGAPESSFGNILIGVLVFGTLIILLAP